MSMTIGSVPKNITRQRYIELLEACGFKANEVKSAEFAADGVYVTAFALDEQGRKIVDTTPGAGYAKHRIFVPVVDNEHARGRTEGSTVEQVVTPCLNETSLVTA